MNALPSFSQKDVIRGIALVAVVAFPLIANAQLGPLRPVKTSNDVSPAAATITKTPVASRDSCVDEHWPFFSKGCLRGSAEMVQPRLVLMNVESSSSSATSNDLSKLAKPTDIARGNALIATKSKKIAKSRIATHTRERRNISVNYAVNSEANHMSLAGW
jgi:hypothetical protein